MKKIIFLLLIFLNSNILYSSFKIDAISGATWQKTKTIYGTLSGKVQDSEDKKSVAMPIFQSLIVTIRIRLMEL